MQRTLYLLLCGMLSLSAYGQEIRGTTATLSGLSAGQAVATNASQTLVTASTSTAATFGDLTIQKAAGNNIRVSLNDTTQAWGLDVRATGADQFVIRDVTNSVDMFSCLKGSATTPANSVRCGLGTINGDPSVSFYVADPTSASIYIASTNAPAFTNILSSTGVGFIRNDGGDNYIDKRDGTVPGGDIAVRFTNSFTEKYRFRANGNFNALAGYQVAGVAQIFNVTSDFTTANNANLQNITGLSWTVPANTALNIPFHCALAYSQGTAAVAVAFGIQDVTVAPTNLLAMGQMFTNTTAVTEANVTVTTTTATAIVSATPSAITTVWNATLDGFIEAPSNASASAVNIMVSTANGLDAVTVKRGSFCRIF